MLTLTDKQVKQIPFRSGKFNVAPNNEQCRSCGDCCKRYHTVELYPVDFKLRNLEKELRIMTKMDILSYHVSFAPYSREKYPHCPVLLTMFNCPVLDENGCRLEADVRPVVCGHYRPVVGEACRMEWSDWFLNLPEDLRVWSGKNLKILKKVCNDTYKE